MSAQVSEGLARIFPHDADARLQVTAGAKLGFREFSGYSGSSDTAQLELSLLAQEGAVTVLHKTYKGTSSAQSSREKALDQVLGQILRDVDSDLRKR